MDGMDVCNTMGVNTGAAFDGTADDALVVGDFAVLENELRFLSRNRAINHGHATRSIFGRSRVIQRIIFEGDQLLFRMLNLFF